MAEQNIGRVVQVIGPVLDVEFADGALQVRFDLFARFGQLTRAPGEI